MRFLRVILLAWGVTAIGSGAGALAGGLWGAPGRFIGATIAGTLAVLLSVRLLTALGWFDIERRRGATIGGLVGLALAAPFAQMQLAMPWPFLPVVLVGIVMILAAGPRAVLTGASTIRSS